LFVNVTGEDLVTAAAKPLSRTRADAVNQDSCLAAARRRENEQWAAPCSYGLELAWVE
jgi:hypothetical protein